MVVMRTESTRYQGRCTFNSLSMVAKGSSPLSGVMLLFIGTLSGVMLDALRASLLIIQLSNFFHVHLPCPAHV